MPPSPRQILAPFTTDIGYVPPRSSIIAVTIALATLVGSGLVIGAADSAVLGLCVGVLLAAAIAAVNHDRLWGPLVGGGVLLVATATAVGVPAYYFGVVGQRVNAGFVLAGLFAGLGLARFRLDAIGEGAVSRAIAWILRVGVLLGVAVLVVSILGVDVAYIIETTAVGGVLGGLLVPTAGSESVLGLAVLSWLTLGSLWLVLTLLPPADAFDPPQEAYYGGAVSIASKAVTLLLGGGGLAIVGGSTLNAEFGITPWAVPIIEVIASSATVRAILVRVLLVALVVAVLIQAVRSAGPALVYGRPAWLPSGIAVAGILVVGAVVATPRVTNRLSSLPSGVGTTADGVAALVGPVGLATFLALLAVMAIAGVLLMLPLLSGAGFLPASTAGPRLVLLGLAIAGGTGAVAETSPVIVLAAIVGGLIVWDVAEHGAELTADVGVTPAYREGELVHAGGSVLVGGVVAAGALGIHTLIREVSIQEETVLTVVGVTVVATVLLAIVLRR
jgi:hypothetical protein